VKKLKCSICGISQDEVEHMIGINYNHLDHKNKKDSALCDECIMEAHKILTDVIFKEKIQQEIQKFLERQ